MFKGKFVVLSLLAAALLSWQIMPGVGTVNSGIVDPCSSSAWLPLVPDTCMFNCPINDGRPMSFFGTSISVEVKDNTGAPIVGIPPSDFWLVGCTGVLNLCGGTLAVNADASTNVLGQTTISGLAAAGGCDAGVYVICQGTQLNCPTTCIPIPVTSVDENGDLLINVQDVGLFSGHFPSPPKPYTPVPLPGSGCSDYNCDNLIDVVDVGIFSEHFIGHDCP